ncbi:MAG: 2Fe-2S iron-sulfur cluster-binding family protein [Algiphilus sp.]
MGQVIFVEADGNSRCLEAAEGQNLMQCAVDHLLPGIAGDCGGCCSCATCHAYVDPAWLAAAGVAGEEERMMLEGAVEPKPNSRLLCQITMSKALDGVVIYLPEPAF